MAIGYCYEVIVLVYLDLIESDVTGSAAATCIRTAREELQPAIFRDF
jgi:hypothetical protein